MKRKLLIGSAILLLLNISIYFISQKLTYNQASSAPSFAANKEVNPHFIRLNKELEGDFFEAETLQAGDNNEHQASIEDAAHCYRLGPFLHQPNYKLAEAVLYNAGLDYQKSSKPSKTSSVYRVYIGPFFNHDSVVDERNRLKRNNIFDHFSRKIADNQYVVSLGIYSDLQRAERAVQLYQGKGETVKIKQEELLLPTTYWLHFRSDENNLAYQQLAAMKWSEVSAKLGRYQCSEQ